MIRLHILSQGSGSEEAEALLKELFSQNWRVSV
jgi:hypothetical protein